jgi:hypothetical protein
MRGVCLLEAGGQLHAEKIVVQREEIGRQLPHCQGAEHASSCIQKLCEEFYTSVLRIRIRSDPKLVAGSDSI